jgi:hypothetical protein
MKNKFILTEEESKRILSLHSKKIQEERNTTSNSLLKEQDDYGKQNQNIAPETLGIDVKNGTLKLKDDLELENAQVTNRDELKLFKGAIFKAGQNFSTNKILVANTTIQMVGTYAGRSKAEPYKSEVHYYCKSGKFNIPGKKDTYYNDKENDSLIAISNAFKTLCKLAKNPQVSSKDVGDDKNKEQKDQKLLTTAKSCGYKSIDEYKKSGWVCKVQQKIRRGGSLGNRYTFDLSCLNSFNFGLISPKKPKILSSDLILIDLLG